MGMSERNEIGISRVTAEKLSEKLNIILASYQVFSMNVKGFHWKVQGTEFFDIHEQMDGLFQDTLRKMDALAERILTLGGNPVHNHLRHIQLSEVQETKEITGAKLMVDIVIDQLRILLRQHRDVCYLAHQYEDYGTFNMSSEFIANHEKQIWMFEMYLK